MLKTLWRGTFLLVALIFEAEKTHPYSRVHRTAASDRHPWGRFHGFPSYLLGLFSPSRKFIVLTPNSKNSWTISANEGSYAETSAMFDVEMSGNFWRIDPKSWEASGRGEPPLFHVRRKYYYSHSERFPGLTNFRWRPYEVEVGTTLQSPCKSIKPP